MKSRSEKYDNTRIATTKNNTNIGEHLLIINQLLTGHPPLDDQEEDTKDTTPKDLDPWVNPE